MTAALSGAQGGGAADRDALRFDVPPGPGLIVAFTATTAGTVAIRCDTATPDGMTASLVVG